MRHQAPPLGRCKDAYQLTVVAYLSSRIVLYAHDSQTTPTTLVNGYAVWLIGLVLGQPMLHKHAVGIHDSVIPQCHLHLHRFLTSGSFLSPSYAHLSLIAIDGTAA